MKKIMSLLALLSAVILLGGCLHKTSEQASLSGHSRVLIGQLFDAPLANIHYHSDHFTGVTSTQGEFLYLPNDRITFTLGNYQFAKVKAAPHLSLSDLFPGSQSHHSVINLLRLLGSISEVTVDNKVILPNLAELDLAALDFSQSLRQFAKDPLVLKLLTHLGNQLNTQQWVPSEVVFDLLQIMNHGPQNESHSQHIPLQMSSL